NEGRIALKAFRRGNIFNAMIFPQTVLITKRANAGFRANARAGENHDGFVSRQIQHRAPEKLQYYLRTYSPGERSCAQSWRLARFELALTLLLEARTLQPNTGN